MIDTAARAWMKLGACASQDAPAGAGGLEFVTTDPDEISAAKAVCAGCTVRATCLRWALEHGETDGIWGGTTPRDRRTLCAQGPAVESAAVARPHAAENDRRSETAELLRVARHIADYLMSCEPTAGVGSVTDFSADLLNSGLRSQLVEQVRRWRIHLPPELAKVLLSPSRRTAA